LFKAAMIARGATAVQVYLQRKAIAGQDDPTTGRVVFVPTSDEITPPSFAGGNPRSRRDRVCGAELHVWGAVADQTSATQDTVNFANAESLLHTVINSLLDISNAMVTMGPAAWDTRTPIAAAGYLVVMPIAIRIPVTDVTYDVSPDTTAAQVTTQLIKHDGDPGTDAPGCVPP
jgi:hypothetical protein